jgi:hypothetical protein
MLRLTVRSAAVLAALSLTVAVAVAGPPWISIEYPANPHDPIARGAFMTVRTYHHGDLIGYQLTGTAEGLVNGQRRSQPLEIRRMSQPGTYAVRWQKPAEGTWALVVSSARDGVHQASALVSVGNDGRVASVTVPSRSVENGRWQVPRAVAAGEVDALLRAGAALAAR